MPLAPSSRAVVRIAALGLAALVLGAAAYELPPRIELGAGPNPRELAGTYEVEPESPLHPTATRRFAHLLPDGRVRYERLELGVGDDGLAATVGRRAHRETRWSVASPTSGGPLARLFARPRLCIHTAAAPAASDCTPFERDPRTGDVAFRLEPTVLHRAPAQRLSRLRVAGLPD